MSELPTPDYVTEVIARLRLAHPDAHCALDYETPLQLLAAVILSAQCTDTGFYRNKARFLRQTAARLLAEYDGQVPSEMDALLSLPGVARKTANVVRGEIYGLADGVTVDTHVKRLSGRLGLTTATDPVKVERDLMAVIPRQSWIEIAHLLIWHGRRVCAARKPNCPACPLNDICPSSSVQWSVVSGQWSVVSGQWSVGSGQ